jgi:NADPH:quinone reductase-like Zn-dependent oxidoreductase
MTGRLGKASPRTRARLTGVVYLVFFVTAVLGAVVAPVWSGNRTIRHLIGVRLASLRGTRKAALFIAKLNKADLLVLQKLLVEREITPVIDRCYALNRVPEAFNYMGEGHAKGKIIINV